MITVEEIRKKSLKIYIEVLRSHVTGVSYFPKRIRSDKSLSKDFVTMSKEIAHVIADSKDRKGFGYTVITEKVQSRNHGFQDIPKGIIFETDSDYLKFIGKTKEYENFKTDCDIILDSIPELKDWMIKNPLFVITNTANWNELVVVCRWFMNDYRVNEFYIRELPIIIHTKFIESNIGILRSLLDFLIPQKVNYEESDFEKRFRLKYAEPRIRLRFLDKELFIDKRFKDISIPLHEFAAAHFDCRKIYITENKMNFLTLPDEKHTIGIWGGGFAVKNLKDIEWLKDKHIFYWGDIDVQGFEILSQLRSYYSHTQSVMMDKMTFNTFAFYHGKGSKSSISSLQWLTIEEHKLYKTVMENNLRLEQEKIPQGYVNKVLSLLSL